MRYFRCIYAVVSTVTCGDSIYAEPENAEEEVFAGVAELGLSYDDQKVGCCTTVEAAAASAVAGSVNRS